MEGRAKWNALLPRDIRNVMPLSSRTVGASLAPVVHDIDARWTMAYAAGLGDTLECYLDTRRRYGVVGHPLFPVCIEWPAVVAARGLPGHEGLTEAERARSVHATHDLLIGRLVRPGDRLTTRLTIVGVERRQPGAYQVMRLDTTDATGAVVCTTWMGSLYLGVDVEGPDHPAADAPPTPAPIAPGTPARAEFRLPIVATAAHVYTECARIWNPIHTDRAFAAAVGLPSIILQGTATLALAVSRVVATEANGDPECVRRVAGRLGAMVPMPSEAVVRIMHRDAMQAGEAVRFEVRTSTGAPAVRDGLVMLG
jgi:acyl dehydratase